MINSQLNSSEVISADELLKTIKAMNKHNEYYTKEQLEYLEQRREELGEERINEAQEEWKELVNEVRTEMQKGADPAGKRMQKLAGRCGHKPVHR